MAAAPQSRLPAASRAQAAPLQARLLPRVCASLPACRFGCAIPGQCWQAGARQRCQQQRRWQTRGGARCSGRRAQTVRTLPICPKQQACTCLPSRHRLS